MMNGESPAAEVTKEKKCTPKEAFDALIESKNPITASIPGRIGIQLQPPADYDGEPVTVYLGKKDVFVPEDYMIVKDENGNIIYNYGNYDDTVSFVQENINGISVSGVKVAPTKAALICYAYCMFKSGKKLRKLPSNHGSGFNSLTYDGRSLRTYVEDRRY